MGLSVTYNADTVIMWSNTTTTRHYLRTNESGSTHTAIVDNTDILTISTSSYWSKTATTGMVSGDPYTANYHTGSAWAGAYSFTANGTLKSSSNMITYQSAVLDTSTGKFSLDVKLQGWGFNGNAGTYPNITVTCKYGTDSQSISANLYNWQNNYYTFTGLSPYTTYTLEVVMATPGYTLASTTVTMPRAYKVTYYHYKGSTYSQSTSEYVLQNTSITLATKAVAITGYSYDHATNSSGTTITTATITAATTFYLYYIASGGAGWWIYDGSKWVKVTTYIYNGGWVKCNPCLYNGNWIAAT